MKKILVIGAGWEQLALIERIKERGLQVVASHPSRETDSSRLADAFFIKSPRDIAAHIRIANTYDVDAIISDNCDYSLLTAAIVASKFGMPFVSVQSALYSNDKYRQRLSCQRAGILQPEFHLVRTPADAVKAADSIGYPVITKPVDSRGTFGVTIVNRSEQLLEAYYDAIAHSPSHTLICERFIHGELVTVDGFCFSNGHESMTIASRQFSQGNKPVTRRITYPADHSVELKGRLLRNHHRVVEALGYKFGHTHGEYIISADEEIFLVECANRGAGVYTSSTINPLITGVALNDIYVDQCLGIDKFVIEPHTFGHMKRAAILSFEDMEVGKVVRKINSEEMAALPFVKKFRSAYKEKQMVEPVDNCATRHLMAVVDGDDSSELNKNYATFRSKLKVEYF